MKLQKLIHNSEDILGLEEDTVIVHGVNEIELGGEFTICGRAIPDSCLKIEGWEKVGSSFIGRLNRCECESCRKIIAYFKRLK